MAKKTSKPLKSATAPGLGRWQGPKQDTGMSSVRVYYTHKIAKKRNDFPETPFRNKRQSVYNSTVVLYQSVRGTLATSYTRGRQENGEGVRAAGRSDAQGHYKTGAKISGGIFFPHILASVFC